MYLVIVCKKILADMVVEGSFGCRSGDVRESFGVVWESFGGRSGVVRGSFRGCSAVVRQSFEIFQKKNRKKFEKFLNLLSPKSSGRFLYTVVFQTHDYGMALGHPPLKDSR